MTIFTTAIALSAIIALKGSIEWDIKRLSNICVQFRLLGKFYVVGENKYCEDHQKVRSDFPLYILCILDVYTVYCVSGGAGQVRQV